MKILILNWRDIKHPLAGGAEISLHEHAKYWKSLHNEVVWFSSNFPNAKTTETVNGINIIRKGSHYTVHFWAYWYYVTNKLLQADIVIDSFHFISYLTPFYMKRKQKIIGLINEVAGKLWYLNIISPFSFIGYTLEPSMIRLYKNNYFITGSNSAKKELMDIGISEHLINIVPHGFHLSKVSHSIEKESEPTMIFLGRIAKDKGIVDILKTFEFVSKSITNIHLWIVGKEEKEGTMNELLSTVDKDLRKRIHYYGFVNQEEKFTLLRKAWVLVHPSYKEGWGLTIIEAASQGTPAVGYNVAGLQDSIRDGKTGILVEPKNVIKLSAAVIKICKDKKYYSQLSESAIKWSKNFTWEKSVKKSWRIIKDVYEN